MACTTRTARWGLLLPDPTICGVENVVDWPSYMLEPTDQVGPTTPAFSATSTNVGGASPIGVGTPLKESGDYYSAFERYKLRTSKTGQSGASVLRRSEQSGSGLVANPLHANFVWSSNYYNADEYVGVDDYRRLWFCDSPDVDPLNGVAVRDFYPLYLEDTNRVAIFHIATDGVTFRRYTTGAEESNRNWTVGTFTVPGIDATREAYRLAVATMPDGALFMAVLRSRGTPTLTFALDAYRSVDGGATWTFLTNIQDFLFSTTPVRLAFARSGGWLRIAVSPSVHYTSGDGGATWSSEVFVGAAGNVNNVSVVLTPTNDVLVTPDPSPFAICALDDSGSFAFAYKLDGADGVYIWRTRGAQPWSYVPGAVFHAPSVSPQPYDAFGTASLAMRVYRGVLCLVVACKDTTPPAFPDYLGTQHLLVSLDLETLRPINTVPLTRFVGCENLTWGLRAEVAAGRMWLFGGMADESTPGTPKAKIYTAQIGGWTGRSLGISEGPVGSRLVPVAGYDGALCLTQWMGLCGLPQASAASAWAYAAVGSPLIALTLPKYLQVAVSNTAHRALWTREIEPPPSGNLLQSGGFEVVATVDVVSTGANAYDGGAIRIDAADAGVIAMNLWIVCRDGIISVHRNTGGAAPSASDLVFSMVFDTSEPFEVRLAVRRKGPGTIGTEYNLELAAAHVNNLRIWTKAVALIDILTAVPVGEHGGDRISFGVYDRVATVRFYDVGILKMDAYDNRGIGFVNPDSLIGHAQTLDPVYLANGVSVRFGGGSTFRGDTWDARNHFTHGLDNVFTASPRRYWSADAPQDAGKGRPTDGLKDQRIYFDADPEGVGKRFEHTGIYLGGSSESAFTVRYSNAADFSSGVTSIGVDASIATGLVVASTSTGSLVFTAPTVSVDPKPGEWVDCFIKLTSGANINKAFRVRMNSEARRIHLDDPTGLMATTVPGVTFSVISPSTFKAYDAPVNARYMEIQFNDSYTGTGDHRLGALVVGTYLKVNIPMNWTFQDAETERVTAFVSDGGDYWAREDAPAARAITGEVVGDVNRTRDALRYMLRATSRYNLKPALLVLDQEAATNHVYGVWQGGLSKANVAKTKFDDGNGLFDVGDTSVTFQELK